MALTKELLKVLDDESEPLPKRLKIADSAFKSVTLPIQRRETILLKWLGRAAVTNETEAWNLLLSWLTSPQMQDLSRNDITQEDVKNLMNLLVELVQEPQELNWDTVIGCVTALVGNKNFQLFFKYDVEGYCVFISNVLDKIESEEHLQKFIRDEQLFNRSLISSDKFNHYFTISCLANLSKAAEKFANNQVIFQEISKLVQKCLFHRNFKNFSHFLKLLFEEEVDSSESPSKLVKTLFKNLHNFYAQKSDHVYKLVFHSYCATYNNNFEMIYKFFIVMVEILGFGVTDYYNLGKLKKYENTKTSLKTSIEILTGLCQVLTENTIDSSLKIRDKTFSELLQILATSIVSMTSQPDENIYNFLNCIILLDPLIIEKRLEDILVYVMLSDKETTKVQYEKFLISIFEVFTKLHRIPNLISKIIRTLKSALEKSVGAESDSSTIFETYQNVQTPPMKCVIKDVMPIGVLNYFTHCITTLVSWQVINLFKTLLFHLDEAVNMDLSSAVETKVVYIEVISTLMCQFLSSVRIAEHTVSTTVVEKFVNTMNEFKEVLGKFGTALVNMEHNPTLMRAYLNVCHTWGELYVILAYYSINDEVVLQRNLDSDTSACNITYLHPYLTRDQWCLISQRIANFGEKPCKQIMHKLYIQKLKAMMLFEETINEDVVSAVRTTVLSSVDDYWKDVIFDPLVLDQIISKASSLQHIAKIILQEMIKTNNFQQLSLIFDCKELIGAMLYTCLHKIDRLLKRKQKKEQPPLRTSLSSKIFPYITENMFLNPKESLEQLTEVFVKELKLDVKNSNTEVMSAVNEKDLSNYMDVIKAIPVVQCDAANIQQILIMHLMCVLLDLQCSNLNNPGLISKCEAIIIGVAQNYNGSFKFLIKPFVTTRIVIDRFSRYTELFTFVVNNIFKRENFFKEENDLENIKDGIKFLTKNIDQEKYLQCAMIVVNSIGHKHKKYTIAAQYKNLLMEYEEEICKNITQLIEKQTVPDINFIEAFTLSLNYYLSKNCEKDVGQILLPSINGWIEEIISKHTQGSRHIKGAALFFTTILRNKSNLKILQDDIVMKTWEYCQNLNVDDKEQEQYSQLVVLIFEQIPTEQFAKISNDLLKSSTQALNENNVNKFTEQLKIWNTIVLRSLNPKKLKMLQEILKSLLLGTIVVHLKDDKQMRCESIYENVVKFETNMILNLHLLLTAPLIDSILVTVSIINSNPSENFASNFTLCVSLMETLLKFRKPLLMDCLPSYLQRYRAMLNKLCLKSNSDLKLEAQEIQQVSDCAHKLEKLTKTLVNNCSRDLVRISPYLIADILKHYEKITLLPNVKIHLNNCLYSLVSLCDEHAISYLKRILSTASTEMFKVTYANYMKYYKFTGKV